MEGEGLTLEGMEGRGANRALFSLRARMEESKNSVRGRVKKRETEGAGLGEQTLVPLGSVDGSRGGTRAYAQTIGGGTEEGGARGKGGVIIGGGGETRAIG